MAIPGSFPGLYTKGLRAASAAFADVADDLVGGDVHGRGVGLGPVERPPPAGWPSALAAVTRMRAATAWNCFWVDPSWAPSISDSLTAEQIGASSVEVWCLGVIARRLTNWRRPGRPRWTSRTIRASLHLTSQHQTSSSWHTGDFGPDDRREPAWARHASRHGCDGRLRLIVAIRSNAFGAPGRLVAVVAGARLL